MVPRQAVGVVIGKQGEMIKRIQQETGARVQFQVGKEDSTSDRVCMLTGSPDQCQNASAFITELIQSVLVSFYFFQKIHTNGIITRTRLTLQSFLGVEIMPD